MKVGSSNCSILLSPSPSFIQPRKDWKVGRWEATAVHMGPGETHPWDSGWGSHGYPPVLECLYSWRHQKKKKNSTLSGSPSFAHETKMEFFNSSVFLLAWCTQCSLVSRFFHFLHLLALPSVFLAPGSPLPYSSLSILAIRVQGNANQHQPPAMATTATDLIGYIILFIEQIVKTKVFMMIYRKFLRPRELLDIFIERFEELGDDEDDDNEEIRNARLR